MVVRNKHSNTFFFKKGKEITSFHFSERKSVEVEIEAYIPVFIAIPSTKEELNEKLKKYNLKITE